jgi:hypothetical protein
MSLLDQVDADALGQETQMKRCGVLGIGNVFRPATVRLHVTCSIFVLSGLVLVTYNITITHRPVARSATSCPIARDNGLGLANTRHIF